MDTNILTGIICSGFFLGIVFLPVLIRKYRIKPRSAGPEKTATSNHDGPVFFSMFGGDSGSSCGDGGGSGCDGGGGCGGGS